MQSTRLSLAPNCSGRTPRWLAALLTTLSLCLAAPPGPAAGVSTPSTPARRSLESRGSGQAPSEVFEVVKIVDGDTIHIQRDGKKVKLRLLSVDTEEKLSPGQQMSASKPQTVFGEETRLWTIDFLGQFRGEDGKLWLGLRFPDDQEAYDVYGRLLCHVLLPDGTDFNLLLVELGKSPYFNKYGNSRICHEEFVAAQDTARRNLVGIWNPRTNEPQTPDSPSARRPYERLLPWWQVRATAIDNFRRRSRQDPEKTIDSEDSQALAAAMKRGVEVQLFGSPDRFFDEEDGSRTVLFRATDRKNALRVSIPESARQAFEILELDDLREEFRQNYVFVRGVVTRGERGYLVSSKTPEQWELAGPNLD